MLDAITLVDLTFFNATGYLLVTLGILISIRFAGYPDLTADGSFTIGAVVYAVLVSRGNPIIVAFAGAAAVGMLAGACTAATNQLLRVGKIISSVIVMLALISVAPYVASGATVGLLDQSNWLAALTQFDKELTRNLFPDARFSVHPATTAVYFLLWLALAMAVFWFFRRRLGIEIRYVGSASSPSLVPVRRRKWLVLLGLCLGNLCIGLGGAIEAERRGGFAVNMGLGTILIALACLVLGESIIKTWARRDHLYVFEYILAVLLGVLLYSFLLQLLLYIGLIAVDIRLTTVLLLLSLLAFAAWRHPNTARLF